MTALYRLRVGLLAAIACVALSPAGAQSELCTFLERPEPGDRLAEAASLADAACGTAQTTEGVQHHCHWQFGYRDARAEAAFDDLDRRIRGCLDQSARIERDQSVNHPDSYDQWAYRYAGGTVRLSIKDKAALGQTLVLLAVEPGR